MLVMAFEYFLSLFGRRIALDPLTSWRPRSTKQPWGRKAHFNPQRWSCKNFAAHQTIRDCQGALDVGVVGSLGEPPTVGLPSWRLQ